MRGIINNSQEGITTCRTWDDYDFLDSIGLNFSIEMSAFLIPKCLGMIYETFSRVRRVFTSAPDSKNVFKHIFSQSNLAPCQVATYQVGVSKYEALSGLYIENESDKDIESSTAEIKNGPNETNDEYDYDDGDDDYFDDCGDYDCRTIYLFYTTTDVKVFTTSVKVDFNTFISNVGGSLGLFIGFSVLGGFFFVYDAFSSQISSNI